MSVFLRRYLFDPGNEVLLEIESVNVLDLEPPSSISGVGTGTVICVGEYENGDFNTPIEPSGTSDFVRTVGEMGYSYNGVKGNNPCARGRRADSAIVTEYWNGNAFVQLNAKKFRRLICVRVDTSVGKVELRRQAFVTGEASFVYNLEPSQTLGLDIGAGNVVSTFTATAATVTGVAGTFPTTFAGGETLTLGYDGAANFTTTFLLADQSLAQVVARINAYAGFTFVDTAGGQLRFTGIQRGNGAQIRVVSGSTGVLALLGLTAATTTGTGNVSNIDAVNYAEIRTVVEAAMTNLVKVVQDSSGALRISKVYVADGDFIRVGPSTATGLGFTQDQEGTNDGFAKYQSGAETWPLSTVGTITLGADDESNFTVALTVGMTQAQFITAVNAGAGYTMAIAASGTRTLLTGRANGGQVRVVALTGVATLAETAFPILAIGVLPAQAGTVPAGTVIQNVAGDRVFVTMQDVAVKSQTVPGLTASGSGPYTTPIRHALDDGSGQSANAGTLTVISTVPDLASFAVVNPQTATTALTEAALDAQYVTALAATLDLSSVAKEANVIFSARQSNAIRRALRSNVLAASAKGMFGRMACVRTPMGTTKAAAKSRTATPGVGATRDQRVIFCYPQSSTFVPTIARRGLSGGAGFSADGITDVGADGVMASILSQLPPEENPGQLTSFTDGVVGLESSANAAGFEIDDYIAFKAAGIAALRMDDGVAIFQSGVTSVDPGVYPSLKNIARRRMADFIQDTLSRRLKAFGKKLSTLVRRNAITMEIRTFMGGLISKNNPQFQRIDGFSLDDKTGNTPTTLAQGLYRIILKVRTLSSLDSIVLETTIGESVTIDETLPQAA